MIKKINILIFGSMVIFMFVSLSLQYEEFHSNKVLLDTSIVKVEQEIIAEYKSRLKSSIKTTFIVIESTYKRIIKNHKTLITSELNRMQTQTKNYNKNEMKKYIQGYKHTFFRLSFEKTDNIVQQKNVFNNIPFYMSIDNKRIDSILENAVRDFLYKNIIGNEQYTWINKVIDFNGGKDYAIRLIHPNLKHTEGKFLSTSIEDIQGSKPYLEELAGINLHKEVYLRYYFKKLKSEETSEKITYAKLYSRKDWIIGTGISLSYLNASIEQRRTVILENFQKYIYGIISSQIIIFIFLAFILLFLRSKLITSFRKIDELKDQLSKKLKSTQMQANTFFNLSINLQLIADWNGKVIQISNSCEDILGYMPNEIENTSFLDLIHPEDIDSTIKEMERLQRNEVVNYFENRYKHKDGKYIVLAWSANMNEDNTLIYASAHDKTQFKDNEELVLEQAKMASMGKMLENIAHQWRQPLSVISTISSSTDISNELGILEKDEISSSMKNINYNVEHLSTTIEDFRSFYKSDKVKKEFQIKDTFVKTFKLISSQFKTSEITIVEEIEDVLFIGVENELIQVLINIINNARDELIKKKDTRLLFVNVSLRENFIEISILDNAGGIPQIVLPQVFDSHFSTKLEGMGTGVGLYMSKMIIEDNINGKIEAKNKEFMYEDVEYIGAELVILLPIK